MEIIMAFAYQHTEFLAPIAVLFLASILYLALSRLVIAIVKKVSKKTKSNWDDFLLQRRFFHQLCHLPSLILLYHCANYFMHAEALIIKLSYILMIWFCLRALSAFLNALNDVYQGHELAKQRPIKGHLQIVNIFFYCFALIGIVSIIIDKSPWMLISGLGAMTAILLLIFKDTILSFIAGMQITFNDLFRIGDWIEVPSMGADGEVIDIALHTIQVQNWDKTITIIPTHKVMEGSFKNWKGMEQSGGRRIKRAINIDMTSVTFLTLEQISRFKKIHYLTDYLTSKESEIAQYNQEQKIDTSEVVNGRRLTNVGTLRAYMEGYLRHHPGVHQGLTFLVRQLNPSSEGIPLEIYIFTNDTRWASYENIQADIFDHLLAVIPEFGLRVFQSPSGYDFRNYKN